MATTSFNATQITPPRVPIIDDRTGLVSREWYRYFYSLYAFTGGGTGILPVTSGGTGLDTIPTDGQLLIGDTASSAYKLHVIDTGSGIGITNGAGTILITNTGVLSNIAGSGIGVSSATGNVTVSNTGVLSAIAGSGISVSSATGNVTFANTGVLSFSGGSTGLLPSSATTGAVSLSGTLGVGYGGTGQITYTNGQLLIGNTTGNTLTKTTLTAGSGVSISNGAGSITISATGSGGTVTAVTGTAPVVSSGGTTPAISMPKATTSVDGYLSSTDWTTFNNKGSGTVTSVTATSPVASTGGATPDISMPAATTSVSGYLTSTDWNTFNGKQPAGTYVTSITVTSSNGLAGTVTSGATPAITLSTSITGVLKGNGTAISAATSGTDYAPATSGSAILYGNGAGGFSSVTIGTGVSFAGGTLSATGSGGTVTSVTGTAPVVSSGGATPAISMAAATTSVNGYLTSTDWTTFNGKQAALVSGTNIKTVNGTTLLGSGDVGTINYAYGGTGQTTVTTGDLLYGSAANTWSKLAVGTTGQILRVVSGAPAWGADYVGTVTSVGGTGTVNGITLTGTVTSSGNLTLGGTLSNVSLTTQVSGTLPVGNGGTGLTTLASGYIPYGNGTSAFASSSGFNYSGNTLTATTGVSGNSNVLSLVNSNTAAGGVGVSIRGYSSNGSNNLGQIDFGGNGSTGGNIDFYTASSGGTNTFSLRLASSNGNLQFQQSNAGIVFNNSSASVNSTLNDYEQGTWTPGVTSSSGSITSYTSSGTYTKIGRLVTVTGDITITNGGTASGVMLLSGFPFTNSLAQQVFGVAREAQLTGVMYFPGIQSSGTTGFILSATGSSVTFTSTSVYYFSITYTATF